MTKDIVLTNYPYLNHFRYTREGLGQERLDVDRLTAEAGSQDPNMARIARRQLDIRWDLDPEKDALGAKTIDLMGQLEEYSEADREIIVSNLIGIQLTQGCNGNCPFCLFGIKKGVEAKYSFGSVVAFMDKHKDSLPREFGLYWDSDPFDYRDGEYAFLDVYKTFRNIRPEDFQGVSTTIPRGGEKDFINFMRFAASENTERGLSGKGDEKNLGVRISLAKHNAQRVEATFEKLTAALLEDGLSESEINAFYDKVVSVGSRTDDSIHQIGPLINRHDDFRDVYTPACRDGGLLAPSGVKGVMMTVPTIYEPSGQKEVTVEKGFAHLCVPRRVASTDYFSFEIKESLPKRTEYKQTMLPEIRRPDKSPFTLDDSVDGAVLVLGRETAAIGRLIIDIADLASAPNAIDKEPKERTNYIRVATQVYEERQKATREALGRTQDYLKDAELTETESEKIRFYILLTETYLAEMDFLSGLVRDDWPLETISAVAATLRQVGRAQVDKLPTIVEKLLEIGGKTVNVPRIALDVVTLKTELVELGKHFGITSTNMGDMPHWFRNLVDTLIPEE